MISTEYESNIEYCGIETVSGKPLQLACATDRSYLEMTGVLIASVTSQQHQSDVTIYVFGSGLRTDDKDRLNRCVAGPGKLIFKDIDNVRVEILSRLTTKRHLTVTAYSRILIPEMIPEVDGRILYLDCDVVVNSPLDELFDVDLRGTPAGAVRNQTPAARSAMLNSYLGRGIETPYFNSGVLLIDTAEWRRQGIGEKGMRFAKTWKAESGDHDQAVLNYVLTDNWAELDLKWNSNPRETTPELASEMPLQHFWGKRKPFFADYPKEYRVVYDRYRRMTPWRSKRRTTRFERRLMKRINKLKKWWNA